MSDKLDKFLEDLQEFDEKYSKYGLSTYYPCKGKAKEETAKRFATAQKKQSSQKMAEMIRNSKSVKDFLKKNWKNMTINTAVGAATAVGGLAMMNVAPAAGVAVMVLGPNEAIRLRNNFVSALKKVKKESPEMSKLKRFSKAISIGFRNYAKETTKFHKNLIKGFVKENFTVKGVMQKATLSSQMAEIIRNSRSRG